MTKLSVKQKFIAASIMVALSIVAILFISQSTTSKLQVYKNVEISISVVSTDMLKLRRNEKDFIARNLLKYRDKFNKNIKLLNADLAILVDNINQIGISPKLADSLIKAFHAYELSFSELVEIQKGIGLSPTEGLYGRLREAVHKAESGILSSNNQLLRADMLQLRRNEKDFMLRLKEKYVDKFKKNITIFTQHLDDSNVDQILKNQILSDIKRYKSDFLNLVKFNRMKGLDSNQGIQGQMRNKVHLTEKLLNELTENLKKIVDKEVGNIKEFIMLTDLIGGVLGILVLAIMIWLSSTILKPIRSVVETIVEVSKTNNLSLRSEVKSQDEIGQLSLAFNDMLGKFKSIIEEVTQASIQVHQRTLTMESIASQTVRDVNQQQKQTEKVAAAMGEMSSTIEEVATNASQAAKAAERANEDSIEGKEKVDISALTINEISGGIETAASSIRRVENDSDRIGAVLEVIRGIADQTNLLALNAAIEAARAGEQGRGFAVVADEVRTLASRTQESTQEIQEMVESLQSGAKQAVGLMEESRNQTHDGVSQAADAGIALQKIVSTVEEISHMNTLIASAAVQQEAVSKEIKQNLFRINDISSTNLTSTKTVIESGQKITETVLELKSLVEQFQ